MRLENKQAPHDADAEEAVIGSLLIDPDAMLQVVDFLKPGDFFDDANQAIFSACLALYRQGVRTDQITVAQELQRQGKLEGCGGSANLIGIVARIPTSFHIKHYAGIIHNLAFHRQLIAAAGQIAAIGFQAGQSEESATKVWKVLQSVTHKATSIPGRPADIADAVQLLTAKPLKDHALHLPWRSVEEITGALFAGDMWVLGAHTKKGKTTLLLQIALSLAEAGKIVLYCTAEEFLSQIGMRIVAMRTGIPLRALAQHDLTEEQAGEVAETSAWLAERGLWVVPVSTLEGVKQWHDIAENEAGKVDLVMIDYLQLFRKGMRGENLYETTTNLSNALKQLAINWHVPVLAAAQLNRSSTIRVDKKPTLSDLRDSGVIEQDSSIVMFLHREDKPLAEEKNKAQVLVAANRLFGMLGSVEMAWNSEYRRYEEEAT